ncbi:MAG: type III pantothenate kinase [Flavobacteriaceae bacterium]|jgi:type III pantothenate kinase|uniref:type III pantothenate kinase n=1 Tax=Candidatus Marifrigoribacter sp. Uisw_064 TaxID=3230970 RepID=UPI003AEA836D
MNLIIDVGNTLVKLALFENQVLQEKRSCHINDFSEVLEELEKAFPTIQKVIISSVGNFPREDFSALKKKYAVFVLSQKAKVPFKNEYATPKTLGVDRIALISAAAIKFPKENVLVIDAGSCITYDFLSDDNKYLGGAISPGINMRYEALHNFTDKLPLLDKEKPKKWIGNSTKLSIQIGVVKGVTNEIEGFISLYIEKFKNLTVILTGGDADFLRDSLKNDIFADSNFLLEGLNYILEHNKDSC